MQRFSRAYRIRMFCLVLLATFVFPRLGWAQHSAVNPGKSLALPDGRAEDWSSLSVKRDQLRPERPILGEKDDFPQFTRELIQVKWRQGDPIDLYVIRPKGVANPPVVLYLYGYPSETDRFRDNDYCVRMTQDGFAAVGFVSALTGHRYTMRPMKEWFVSELQEALGSSVHDVQMILNYLSTRNDLDTEKVGMFGTGSGGTIAILTATVDPRIQALDVLNPWGDWPDWMVGSVLIPENERPNYVTAEFLKKVEPLDPIRLLPQMRVEHLRIQDIADDGVTPKAAQARIASAAPAGAEVRHYATLQQFYGASSGGRVFEWLKAQMHPLAGAGSYVSSSDTGR